MHLKRWTVCHKMGLYLRVIGKISNYGADVEPTIYKGGKKRTKLVFDFF
jgi:hypothetical protein